MEIVNLKKVTTDTNSSYFVVIGLNKKKYEEIKEDINKSYSYIDTKVQNEEYRELNKHILFIGDLDRYPYTSKIVYKYKKKHFEGKPIYRNYCSTKEQQAKTQQFVNVAEDADTCWNTVKTALGAKTRKQTCYGIIVEFSLNNNLLEND